ncbi:hypothetical protein EVAR_11568_1 [Eumeta japonica]|uniref:Uncharacterized protein n=1 Tax=Eumeta variegata TaxID=151549 RepID=A0A4C1X559_EUMVA|nr:hypothetical protein EVAR_11568_1 [Eumeta japonica]
MISPPPSVSLSTVSCGFVFAFAGNRVRGTIGAFHQSGWRVSCRVISDVQFRRHPPPISPSCVPQFGQTMSDKRFERPWVGRIKIELCENQSKYFAGHIQFDFS